MTNRSTVIVVAAILTSLLLLTTMNVSNGGPSPPSANTNRQATPTDHHTPPIPRAMRSVDSDTAYGENLDFGEANTAAAASLASRLKRGQATLDPRIPQGYASAACIPENHYNASRFTASSSNSTTTASNDQCLNIPGLKPDIKKKMLVQCVAWKQQFDIKGVRILGWIGRPQYAEVVLRAIRRMLRDEGGAADSVILQFKQRQKADLMPLINMLKFPTGAVHIVTGTKKESRSKWSFKDKYETVVDGWLHIKVDDDLFYLQPDFELYLVHRYLSQRYLAWASDFCEQRGNCSQQGREVRYGWKSKHAVCSILSANIINHVGLTSVHSAMGAVDHLEPQLEWDFMNIRPLARWASFHRSLLRPIAQGRNPLELFDFGLHYFDCDAQPRRWSINCVLFSFDSSVAKKMLADDEDFMSFKHARMLRFMEDTPYPVRTCADGRALAIHASYSGQFTYTWHAPQRKDNVLATAMERLKPFYLAIAKHIDGTQKCCKSTGCPLFAEAAQDPTNLESIMCDSPLKCTFPFTKEEGVFGALENWTHVDGDEPTSGEFYGFGIRPETTTWLKIVDPDTCGTSCALETADENTASDKFFGLSRLPEEKGKKPQGFKTILKSLAVKEHCLFRREGPEEKDGKHLNAYNTIQKNSKKEPQPRLYGIELKKCPDISDSAAIPSEAVFEIQPSPNGGPWKQLRHQLKDGEWLTLTVLPNRRAVLIDMAFSNAEYPANLKTKGGDVSSHWQDFRLIGSYRAKKN